LLALTSFSALWKEWQMHKSVKAVQEYNPPSTTGEKIRDKLSAAKVFVHQNQYNESFCFLVDMSLPSGRNRFFVYALKGDSILAEGLVAHGNCDNDFQEKAMFSNRINSGCSSMGKYKIGIKYSGRFGIAYKLYGLDSSNTNVFQRNIVLHSYSCVPEKETGPEPICNSLGCPMVSPGFMDQLRFLLDHSKKPVLLWLF